MIIRLPIYPARWLIAAVLFATLASGAAQACSGRIISNPNPSLDYNPFNPVDIVRPFAIRIENQGAQSCVFWLSFAPPTALGSWPDGFDFEIRSQDGAILAASNQAPGVSVPLSSGPLDPGDTHTFGYTVRISAGQMLASGNYDQLLELMLWGTADNAPSQGAAPLDRANLALLVSVQDYLGVNIAGAGVMKTIDFGELRTGESRRVVIEARSNSKFTLKASSAKGGALRMDAPYQDWHVPYVMRIDGGRVALPGEIGPFATTTIAGHSFDVGFTIGDVSGKRAGLYSDEITIEIVPAM